MYALDGHLYLLRGYLIGVRSIKQIGLFREPLRTRNRPSPESESLDDEYCRRHLASGIGMVGLDFHIPFDDGEWCVVGFCFFSLLT
jgi:hypothetical protein